MIGVALVPISISGWGLRELAVILLLGHHGVAPERALLCAPAFSLRSARCPAGWCSWYIRLRAERHESIQSWKEVFLDLKRRGLSMGPELAVARVVYYAMTRKYAALGKCPFALLLRVPDPSAWLIRRQNFFQFRLPGVMQHAQRQYNRVARITGEERL